MEVATLCLAPAAAAWLRDSRPARVWHVFDQACNLIDDRGEVLSLVTERVGPGPFALVVTGAGGVPFAFANTVDVTAAVRVAGERLSVGRLQIETATARRWQPRPPWADVTPAALRRQQPRLHRLLWREAPANSMAALLPQAGGQPPPLGPDGGGPRLKDYRLTARAAVELLAQGLRASAAGGAVGGEVALEQLRAAAGRLAGLGPGLTPAGDDFLLGVLYALWACWLPEQVEPVAAVLLAAAVPRTTRLSAAWLRAGARGEAAAPWHVLLAAPDDSALAAAARRIVHTGHTSGTDALSGYLFALAQILP